VVHCWDNEPASSAFRACPWCQALCCCLAAPHVHNTPWAPQIKAGQQAAAGTSRCSALQWYTKPLMVHAPIGTRVHCLQITGALLHHMCSIPHALPLRGPVIIFHQAHTELAANTHNRQCCCACMLMSALQSTAQRTTRQRCAAQHRLSQGPTLRAWPHTTAYDAPSICASCSRLEAVHTSSM
jgi:hypothetical protein